MVREGINLYWKVGVHPKVRFEQRIEEKWERMVRSDRCVGVGEVGWDKEGDPTQEQSLRAGVRLVVKYNKALVIHCRGGDDRLTYSSAEQFMMKCKADIEGGGGGRFPHRITHHEDGPPGGADTM